MNILLLFIFNLFTGALIYLILTLKIEKNSSTFQEKKLKREMAEIIREFNSTAERNITILENHISSLKKLMNENGSLKGVDFTVLDNQLRNNTKKDKSHDTGISLSQKRINDDVKGVVKEKLQSGKQDSGMMNELMGKLHSFNSYQDTDADDTKHLSRENDKTDSGSVSDIRKIDLYADEEIIINYENEKPVDMTDLFQNAEDKYLLIAQLYNEGHSVEDLSKYSGLPSGEIKLVISLNS